MRIVQYSSFHVTELQPVVPEQLFTTMTAAFVVSSATVSAGRRAASLVSRSSSALPMAASAPPPVEQLMSTSLQAAGATTTAFEPIAPDTTTLVGFASIVVLCAVAAWVWANQVVPVSRTKLALSKKNGPVKDYLDELRQAGGEQQVVNENGSQEATALASNVTMAFDNSTTIVAGDRALERWLFTDWLQKAPATAGGRQKPSALPVLKDAKWNSGDNPVLAATALIILGVILTAVTERIAMTLSL